MLSIFISCVFFCYEVITDYWFSGLKEKCKNYLLHGVTVNNCLKLRSYALQYDLQDVLNATHNVVKENFLEVLKLDDFLELDVDDMSDIICKRTEKVLL